MGRGKKSSKHRIPKDHPFEEIEMRPDLVNGELPSDSDFSNGGKNKPPFLNYYTVRSRLPLMKSISSIRD